MKVIKTPLKEVLKNDPNSEYWKRVDKRMKETGFAQQIERALNKDMPLEIIVKNIYK